MLLQFKITYQYHSQAYTPQSLQQHTLQIIVTVHTVLKDTYHSHTTCAQYTHWYVLNSMTTEPKASLICSWQPAPGTYPELDIFSPHIPTHSISLRSVIVINWNTSIINNRLNFVTLTILYDGVCGGAVGWGAVLQPGRSWVRFPMVSLEFFIDIILLVTLWPWGWLSP